MLPEDTFLAPISRIDECIEKDIERIGLEKEGRQFQKDLINKFIGHLVSEDEPVHYKYFASTDPHERPPNAMLLPFRLEPWGSMSGPSGLKGAPMTVCGPFILW